ncbi:hypothetical protein SAMN04515674_113109 [Pseudarcicella hirudinis]|uniref:Uncharacterized protein n=1 Tax=Pseudarcicella hirudinis TaxID=1079859 RepID=A0A1I5X3C8_9BACT|nr:hypothetical protein [Pseudarcicella hirudinis]SFQ26448.1 hypothetical protein SAMN04515674_113109 [Pseudarcicella hirudinis]
MLHNSLSELYQNSKGTTWQCDLTHRIFLKFGETLTAFKVQDFFAFRRKVNRVNIHEMIFNLSDDYDYELVEDPRHNFSHKLTLCEIVQLRDLLDGTKFSIDMNSMLHEVLGEVELVIQ